MKLRNKIATYTLLTTLALSSITANSQNAIQISDKRVDHCLTEIINTSSELDSIAKSNYQNGNLSEADYYDLAGISFVNQNLAKDLVSYVDQQRKSEQDASGSAAPFYIGLFFGVLTGYFLGVRD